MDTQEKARQRAEQIIKVRSGLVSATEAAKILGISRKGYYKWEQRALKGMMDALVNQSSGRPGLEVDEEKEFLKMKLHEAESQVELLEKRLHVRDVLTGVVSQEPKKKERAGKAACRRGGGREAEAGSSIQGTVPAEDTVVSEAYEMARQVQASAGTCNETGTPEVR